MYVYCIMRQCALLVICISLFRLLMRDNVPPAMYRPVRALIKLKPYFISRILFLWTVFTARCTLVQSAVLRSHVVCLSVRPTVRPSVTLVNCDHIGWNSSKIISPLVSLGRSLFVTPTRRVCSKGNTPKFLPE